MEICSTNLSKNYSTCRTLFLWDSLVLQYFQLDLILTFRNLEGRHTNRRRSKAQQKTRGGCPDKGVSCNRSFVNIRGRKGQAFSPASLWFFASLKIDESVRAAFLFGTVKWFSPFLHNDLKKTRRFLYVPILSFAASSKY